MFIKAANNKNGTGFTGDVNTAFRQGRQDAFRDYIDNFNVALKADAANNAENQLNVQRAANNYDFNLKFDNAARDAMIDTVKDSTTLANQVYDFGRNQAKLDAMYPQQEALGQADANTAVNKTLGGESAAAYQAAQNEFKFNNVGQEAENYKQKLETNALELQQKQNTLNEVTNVYNEIKSWTPELWEKNFSKEFLRQMRLNPNENRSDAEILTELRNSGGWGEALTAYQKDIVNTLSNNVNAARGEVNKLYATVDEREQANTKKSTDKPDKLVTGKNTPLSADDLAKYPGGTKIGTTEDGFDVMALPNGNIILRNKNGGYYIEGSMLNGAKLSALNTLNHHGVKYTPVGATSNKTKPNAEDML